MVTDFVLDSCFSINCMYMYSHRHWKREERECQWRPEKVKQIPSIKKSLVHLLIRCTQLFKRTLSVVTVCVQCTVSQFCTYGHFRCVGME